jgi:hypothetical protein
VLVLSKAVLVLVIVHDPVPGQFFGDATRFRRHLSQHRVPSAMFNGIG